MADLKSNGGKGLQNLRNKILPGAARFSYEHAMRMLDSTEVYEVFDNETGKTNLTFRVANEYANDSLFYNLVVERGVGLKITLIEYAMDPIFARQYAEGISGLDRFTGTMTFTLLAVDGAPCGDVPPGGIAIVGGNGPRAPGGELASVIVPPYGSNYSQTLMLAQYIGLSISKGNSGGSNNNGGTSDSDDGIIHDDEVSRSPRYFRVPPSIEDPSTPCGGGDEVGILGPNRNSEDPDCTELNKQSQDSLVKIALADLKIKKNFHDREYGYSISKNNTEYITNQIYNHAPYFPISQTGFTLLFPPASHNAIVVMHTHPNDGLGYLMFSPEDIFYFYNIVKKHTVPLGTTKVMADYSLIVVSDAGTYSIKVNDVNKFISSMTNYNQQMINELLNQYQSRQPMDPIEHFEKDFLNFIQSHNIGISLFKANEDLTNWNLLTLNDNNNGNDGDDIKYTPC